MASTASAPDQITSRWPSDDVRIAARYTTHQWWEFNVSLRFTCQDIHTLTMKQQLSQALAKELVAEMGDKLTWGAVDQSKRTVLLHELTQILRQHELPEVVAKVLHWRMSNELVRIKAQRPASKTASRQVDMNAAAVESIATVSSAEEREANTLPPICEQPSSATARQVTTLRIAEHQQYVQNATREAKDRDGEGHSSVDKGKQRV